MFTKAGIPFQTARKASVLKYGGYRRIYSCLKLIYGFGTYSDIRRWCDTFEIPLSESLYASFRSQCLAKRLSVHGALEAADAGNGWDPKIAAFGSRVRQHITRVGDDLAGLCLDKQLVRLLERLNIPMETGIDEFVSNIMTVIGTADSVNGVGALSRLVMKTDADLVNPKAQKVMLMSMHAAKGLEFPVVFVTGCEAGLIPYAPTGHQDADPDEERRLFYVAMTRARSHLFLTLARRRSIYGRSVDRVPSPFIKDIDRHLLRAQEDMKGKHPKPKQAQLGLFV